MGVLLLSALATMLGAPTNNTGRASMKDEWGAMTRTRASEAPAGRPFTVTRVNPAAENSQTNSLAVTLLRSLYKHKGVNGVRYMCSIAER